MQNNPLGSGQVSIAKEEVVLLKPTKEFSPTLKWSREWAEGVWQAHTGLGWHLTRA